MPELQFINQKFYLSIFYNVYHFIYFVFLALDDLKAPFFNLKVTDFCRRYIKPQNIQMFTSEKKIDST